MVREQSWNFHIDGQPHTVTFVQGGLRHTAITLFVDEGEGQVFWPHSGYLDQPLTIGGRECRFVMRNYLPDVVVDGRFVHSNKEYVPIEELPVGCRVVTLISMVLLIILLNAGHALWRNLLGALMAGTLWLVTDKLQNTPGTSVKAKKRQCLLVNGILLAVGILLTVFLR